MERLRRIPERLRAMRGWKRNLTLFITGGLGVFLFAPFHVWPLLFVLLPVFFVILDAAPDTRRALWDGFFFGYGFFMAGTYWIAISLTVDAEKFAWLIPFCIFGLSACFALYFLLFGVLYRRFRTSNASVNIYLFIVLWMGVEYLRSIGIFGFPWNLLGYSLMPLDIFLQFASVTGVFGLSLLAAMIALAWVPCLMGAGRTYRKRYVAAMLVMLLVVIGHWYLKPSPPQAGKGNTRIRVVQPNIPQQMKWQPGQVQGIMGTLGGLTQLTSEAASPDIVIWPETAVPFTLTSDSEWPPYVVKWLPENGTLLTGVVTHQPEGYGNGLVAFATDASVSARYLKRQLVPFGEFVPLRSLLPLEKITPGSEDFLRGNNVSSLTVKNRPSFLPMICYESAFPWLASTTGNRPEWLLVITNDAWFGNSPGPYQHFEMSRMRAVEQGLPVVRAANTGISAVIDANGRVIKSLALGKQGIIDAALPAPAKRTIYSSYGDGLSGCLLLMVSLLVIRYRLTA